MKVNFTLTQHEIEELVRAKVASLMTLPEGVPMETNFVAGRGSEGGRVEVSIDTDATTGDKAPAPAPAPAAAKPKGPALVKVVAARAQTPAQPDPSTEPAEEAQAVAASRPDFSQARAALADRLVAEANKEEAVEEAPANDEAVPPVEDAADEPPFEEAKPEVTAEAPVPATPARPVFGALKRPDNRT